MGTAGGPESLTAALALGPHSDELPTRWLTVADNGSLVWRRCDLHIHTFPNEVLGEDWDPERFIKSCVEAKLDLIAVTDHDIHDRVSDVIAAASDKAIVVVPGVEVSTDRGHILVLGPGEQGLSMIEQFVMRIGARPGDQVELVRLLDALDETSSSGDPFATSLVVIGAHVDMDGQLLGSPNPLSLNRQLAFASRLHALEVARDEMFTEWISSGVKQGPRLALVRGSDTHEPERRGPNTTWIYLPEVSPAAFQHAFALPEACIRYEAPDSPPIYAIEAVEFSDGMHGGQPLTFSERTNAIIGPPNSGKSLLIDALKFAFGVECDLEDVEAITKSRMAKCLPRGTSITVRVRTENGPMTLTRTVGGAEKASPPFKPIIFSQTELTRRAHEARPSIRLLDLHVQDFAGVKDGLAAQEEQVVSLFTKLIENASEVRRLVSVVGNTEDGLAATKRRLRDLAGTEEVAQTATGVSRVARWRETVERAIEHWREEPEVQLPDIPRTPDGISDHESLAPLVPRERLMTQIESFRVAAKELVARHADSLLEILKDGSPAFDALNEDVRRKLAEAGFAEGSEVEREISALRNRMHDLEEMDDQRRDLEATLDAGLVDLRDLVERAGDLRNELTQLRKDACTRVNASMHTFFAVVDKRGETKRMDELIEDLKVGTYMRPEARAKLREDLDRTLLLENAVRLVQGRLPEGDDVSDQERMVRQAVERERYEDLARLAVIWPGDGLDLGMKKAGGTPTPFQELTEGLRALAIKEISFAASDLPVITDQPEDAVPTRAVYDSLVPTLREQRSNRQFIIVSHDANLVVASDVEWIAALAGAQDGGLYEGSLFDQRVRELALENLEGGIEAFQRRAIRYGRFG